MKILIVSPTFGAFGGIESFVFALTSELEKQDVNVTVCFKRVKGFKIDQTLSEAIARSKSNVTFVNRASKELFKLIKSGGIIHCQNPSIDVAFFAKILGKPLVMTVYNWSRRRLSVYELLWRLAIKLADRCWYISDFVWNSWELNKKRTTSGKMPIVSNLPEGIISSAQRKGFVFAGRWIANKGLEELLDAYAAAEINHDDWPLILVGEGPLRSKVEEKIQEQRIEGVVIKGFVDDNTKNDIIRQAKWVVVPPNTKEDLGLVPIEARNVKVPCIITRDGGLPEAAGSYSLSCEPGNVRGLRLLLEKAAQMGEKEYIDLAEASYQELKNYLKPLSLYLGEYKKLLEEKGK